jgi:hypothetical protein
MIFFHFSSFLCGGELPRRFAFFEEGGAILSSRGIIVDKWEMEKGEQRER